MSRTLIIPLASNEGDTPLTLTVEGSYISVECPPSFRISYKTAQKVSEWLRVWAKQRMRHGCMFCGIPPGELDGGQPADSASGSYIACNVCGVYGPTRQDELEAIEEWEALVRQTLEGD